jgi:GT2 family glycosyltransferase
MKRSTAPACQISIHSNGTIDGILAISQRRPPPERVAILLDGTVHDTVALVPAARGTRRLLCRLPERLIFSALDVLTVPDGESLLGLRRPLADIYALHWGALAADGLFIAGAFTAADFLAGELGVEFLDAGHAVAAQGLAVRDSAGTFRFRLPLATLLRPGQVETLRPRVGGRILDAPTLVFDAAEQGFLGCLDAASPGHVEGWAMNAGNPGQPIKLDVFVDAIRVGTATASGDRPDVQAIGAGAAACGFTLVLPDHPDPLARRRIGVRLAGSRTELTGSPLFIDPVPGIAGWFDSLHGMCAHGWALDPAAPDKPVTVEVIGPGGVVLGAGLANLFRGDLLDAEMNAGLCAFKIDLSSHFEALLDREVIVRVVGGAQLPGSPKRVTTNRNIWRFVQRRRELKPETAQRLRRMMNFHARGHGISFIMPVFDTPRVWLIEALESVRTQFCDSWELICVDDGSRAVHVADVLAGYAARDKRIRVLKSPQNVGIARAVNFGLRVAKYDYVAFIDHDDKLEPDAAWQLLRAARKTDADLLYSDEAQTTENIEAITELRLRPAFSHDYYLSHPYFVHIVCARTDLARRVGGWDESLSISADVDFVLRAIEASRNVVHVPAILYRWRTHSTSTGHTKQQTVMTATMGAIQRHLDRLQTGATVQEGVWFNQFRIDWPQVAGKILIVIPTRNKADLLRVAIESIERFSEGVDYRIVVIDHASDEAASRAYLDSISKRHVVMPYVGEFNFSRMNNVAVAAFGGDAEFILFLNNDVEATQEGFLDRLRRLAARADVGAVGALLMYADKTVQHAGVILGFNDSAEHALKFQPVFLNEKGRRNLGYNCALAATRDYSAVTAACLMLRRSVFEEVGGFDESFGIGFNDTDLCLRIGEAGYHILYDGSTILHHYESATRSQTKQVFHPQDTLHMIKRWGEKLREGDRFYHPNLSLRTQDHVPREDRGCVITSTPRAMQLALETLKPAKTSPPGA